MWNLPQVPIFSEKEFLCFSVGVIFLSLLSCMLLSRILRFLLDIPFPGREFETSIEMSVLRAEIICKLRALPPETQNLGIVPLILKFINNDESQASGHTTDELREELDHPRQGFSEEKKKILPFWQGRKNYKVKTTSSKPRMKLQRLKRRHYRLRSKRQNKVSRCWKTCIGRP